MGHAVIRCVMGASETLLAHDEQAWKHADLKSAKLIICNGIKKLNHISAYLGMM